MPPKRSAKAAGIGGGGPSAASPSPKRVKLSTTESAAGIQQMLDAFFTTRPCPFKSQTAPTLTRLADVNTSAEENGEENGVDTDLLLAR